MDIIEVKKKKLELHNQISLLVWEFYKETEIKEIDIKVSTNKIIRLGSGEEVVTGIDVSIVLNL
jgi:hypothetical protein